MCMYIYMYIYVVCIYLLCICIHTYLFIYIYTQMHIYIYTHINICIYTYIYTTRPMAREHRGSVSSSVNIKTILLQDNIRRCIKMYHMQARRIVSRQDITRQHKGCMEFI